MNERIDMMSFRKSLARFRDACPFSGGQALADEIENVGQGLDGLNDLFSDMDAEIRRQMGVFEYDSPPDEEATFDFKSERTPSEDKQELDMDEEQELDPFEDMSQPKDEPDESMDEADHQQAKLNASLDGAMDTFSAALSELDSILESEVKTKEELSHAASLLAQLKELQNRPCSKSSDVASQMAELSREIEDCRRVEENARRAASEWSQISGAQFGDIVRDLVASANEFAKSHFWSGVAKKVKKRARQFDSSFQKNAREAVSRQQKALALAERAASGIRAKEARLNNLERESANDEELRNKIEELGSSLEHRLKSLHGELVRKFEPTFPVLVAGGKSGSRWNLSLGDEKTIMHAMLIRRMEVLRRCQSIRKEIEKAQAPLEELSEENINKSCVFPPSLWLGSSLYTHSRPGVEIEVPEMVSFPSEKPILVPDASWIAPILLRIAWTMPQGAVEIIALDHASFGMNVQPANDLSDVPGLLRVITGTDGLQDTLDELDKYMGKIGTECFKYGISDWLSYNAKHVRRPLPCKILAVCSLSGFDSWSSLASTLRKVMDNGKRHGVVTILCEDALKAADERTRKALEGIAWNQVGKPFQGRSLERLRFEPVTPEMPENAGELMRTLAKEAKKRAERPAKSFLSLFDGIPMWKTSSAGGLSAVIGWDAGGRPVSFKLDTGGDGGTAVHALVGGQTGSGKSVLLHTLIQSLAYVYSPEELQFYLFDFKNGVEFYNYADNNKALWMPHIKVVSVQNNPRYALALFKYLVEVEFPGRNEKFKQSDCNNIGDYVKSGRKMPRLVVFVDEFQELFGDHDGEDIGREITDGLKAIVKQGRNVGVHLVIATQTMASAQATMKGSANDILQQIGVRLALWGTGEEGILADNNKAAASIIAQKQCILNARAGLNGGNIVFDFPFTTPKKSPEGPVYRMKMAEATKAHGFRCDGKIFNGSILPPPPPIAGLRQALAEACEESFFSLSLGVKPDFMATPLLIPFDNLAGEHLLVGGEDIGKLSGNILPTAVWSGLRASVFRSLANTSSCTVLYYNPGTVSLPSDLPRQFLRASMKTTEAELMELFKRFLRTSSTRKVVFVENYHKAGLLHPGDKQQPMFSFGGTSSAPPQESARSLFLSAFTASGTIPFSTILFTKNVKNTCESVLGRFGSEANILETCSKRIAFNVTGDVLKAMIPDSSYFQQQGPRRVWFEDRKTGVVEAFMPYAEA